MHRAARLSTAGRIAPTAAPATQPLFPASCCLRVPSARWYSSAPSSPLLRRRRSLRKPASAVSPAATTLRRPQRWQSVGENTGAESIVHDIESTDPFQNLGVQRTSTPEEVAAHFKKLAMLYHPDRPGGDEENFQKITKAKEAVLLRLGEKTEDEVPEDVTHHEAEYTYNEESDEWEYKRGKMRVYDDYVDTGVERQRITVYLVQFAIVVSAGWLLADNALEVVYSNVVQQDSMNKEGRMFAASKRREYEKEADVRFVAKYKRGTEENSTYTETYAVEDPFEHTRTKQERAAVIPEYRSFLSRFISFFETFIPFFGRWLRLHLLPDTLVTRRITYGL